MTSLERKDLADEMTCGERGHRRSTRHWACDGKALLDVPALLGLQPQLRLTAPNSKQGQQNHLDEPVNPQTQKVILSAATWLLLPVPPVVICCFISLCLVSSQMNDPPSELSALSISASLPTAVSPRETHVSSQEAELT